VFPPFLSSLEALKLEPNNVNALFRKASALFELDEFEAALAAFKEGESACNASCSCIFLIGHVLVVL
jgi:hypothetical protein